MFKMYMSTQDILTMFNYFFIFLLLEFTLCIPITSQNDINRVTRSNIAFSMIKTKSCLDLISTFNCTDLKKREKNKMHIYIADTNKNEKFQVRPVNSEKPDFNGLDGIVVIDPLPEAHYGHGLILLLIRKDYTKKECKQKNGVYYPLKGHSECMYLPNHRLCLLKHLSKRKFQRKPLRRTPCAFHFFPKVYTLKNSRLNRLQCYSDLNGFGKCPLNKNNVGEACVNAGNCNSEVESNKVSCTESCDHAVLVSGGWNQFINQYRHYENMKDMWNYLTKRGYRQENIKIYFANNSTVNLDGQKSTKETEPAVESSKIVNHIKEEICTQKSRCVDTLTLYLNGPTFQNGDILLWDRNRDGHATDLEVLKLDDLLKPLGNCGARNIIIIADQNYAGHIISKILNLRKTNLNYDKVHVITASSKRSWSYSRDFTKGLIQYDNVYIDDREALIEARPLGLIFKNMKQNLAKKFKIRYLPGKNINNIAITGPSTELAGCRPNIFGIG